MIGSVTSFLCMGFSSSSSHYRGVGRR
jgi:hypothetical protein